MHLNWMQQTSWLICHKSNLYFKFKQPMRLDVDTAQITTQGQNNTFKGIGASSVCVTMTGTMQKECSDQHHKLHYLLWKLMCYRKRSERKNFCTSGCWWVISLARTFSLATNWVSKKKKKREQKIKPIFSALRLFHKYYLMTQINSFQSLLGAWVKGSNY